MFITDNSSCREMDGVKHVSVTKLPILDKPVQLLPPAPEGFAYVMHGWDMQGIQYSFVKADNSSNRSNE